MMPSKSPTRMRIARRLGVAAFGAGDVVDPCCSPAGAGGATSSTIAQPYGPRQRPDSPLGDGLRGVYLSDIAPVRHLGNKDVLATQQRPADPPAVLVVEVALPPVARHVLG